MNKNMLIDFGFVCDDQLNNIYKMIGDLNGEKRFLRKLKDAVITSKSILYNINRELNNGNVGEIDNEFYESIIYELNEWIDNGLYIIDEETNKQILKTLNYLTVYESLMLDVLPEIDNSFFIATTININILECLSMVVSK